MIVLRNIIILLFLVIFTYAAKAEGLFKVDSLYFEIEKTVRTNRGYYMPKGSVPKNNFNLGLKLLDKHNEIFYSKNVISSTTDQSQFRYIALDSEAGVKLYADIDLYYRHYSGHMIDARKKKRFPEENVIGIRFNLISK